VCFVHAWLISAACNALAVQGVRMHFHQACTSIFARIVYILLLPVLRSGAQFEHLAAYVYRSSARSDML
jgi:hypothetical protein